MQCRVFLVILALAVVTNSLRNSPKGLHFLGVGYNLLKGNPEGAEISKGGVDPGLFVTRKIFQLTWRSNKLSVDNKYRVPDQISFAPRASCLTTNKREIIPGPKSYQAKLNDEVKVSPGYSSVLFNVAFTLSKGFKGIQRMTSRYRNVFYEDKHICNKGRARYLLNLARYKNFPVSKDFASAVCLLPTQYDSRAYFNFIENWGTHIVVELELGEKRTERFKSSYAEFIEYAMENVAKSVAVSGRYMGYRTSLKVNIKAFKQFLSRGNKFGHNKVVFKSGGSSLPEPIGLKLVPIYEAFNDYFYTLINQRHSARCRNPSWRLKRRKRHVQRALSEYPRLKNAKNPVDPEVRIPVTWPLGTYGLPKPNAGCPRGTEVSWHSGTRRHDTEDSNPKNSWSSPYNLAGSKGSNNMQRKFCIKTLARASEYSLAWPKGQYCILKKGSCPKGFHLGWIYWDDEDSRNGNWYSGQLPDGSYGRDTLIFYCCRSDGHATNAIILPTESPFVLLKSNTHLCQHVRGMYVRSEYFVWDCEDSSNTNFSGGSKPYSDVGRNIKIHYCYYYY